jgi:hypothetical protein
MAGVNISSLGAQDITQAKQTAEALGIYGIADEKKILRRASRRVPPRADPTLPPPAVPRPTDNKPVQPATYRPVANPPTGPRPSGDPPPLPARGDRPPPSQQKTAPVVYATPQPQQKPPPPQQKPPPSVPKLPPSRPAVITRGPIPPVPGAGGRGGPLAGGTGPPPPPPPPPPVDVRLLTPGSPGPSMRSESPAVTRPPVGPGAETGGGGAAGIKGDLLSDIR